MENIEYNTGRFARLGGHSGHTSSQRSTNSEYTFMRHYSFPCPDTVLSPAKPVHMFRLVKSHSAVTKVVATMQRPSSDKDHAHYTITLPLASEHQVPDSLYVVVFGSDVEQSVMTEIIASTWVCLTKRGCEM